MKTTILLAVVLAVVGRLAAEEPKAWPGWRGQQRDAIVSRLPKTLSASPKTLWTTPLVASAPAGVAATEKIVIVADRDSKNFSDIFRCLDATTGVECWKLVYPAPGKLDHGNGAALRR